METPSQKNKAPLWERLCFGSTKSWNKKSIVELLASLPTWQSLLGTTLPNVSLSAPNMHFLLLLRLLCMCHSSFALHSVCNAGKHNSHLCQASKCVVVDLTHHPHQCCCMKCPSNSTSIAKSYVATAEWNTWGSWKLRHSNTENNRATSFFVTFFLAWLLGRCASLEPAPWPLISKNC